MLKIIHLRYTENHVIPHFLYYYLREKTLFILLFMLLLFMLLLFIFIYIVKYTYNKCIVTH